jgi:hypothetical protein
MLTVVIKHVLMECFLCIAPQDDLRRAEAMRREAERSRHKDEREKEKELELIRKQYLVRSAAWIVLRALHVMCGLRWSFGDLQGLQPHCGSNPPAIASHAQRP